MLLIYFLLWIMLNGRITLEVIISGVIISVLLNIFVRKALKIEFTGATFLKCLKLFPDALFYIIVLLFEIIRANFAIIKLVLAQNIELEPCLVKIDTKLKTEAARVAFANSITLTPGTITVSLNNNELLVHALNREIAQGLDESIFERILTRMERRANA